MHAYGLFNELVIPLYPILTSLRGRKNIVLEEVLQSEAFAIISQADGLFIKEQELPYWTLLVENNTERNIMN